MKTDAIREGIDYLRGQFRKPIHYRDIAKVVKNGYPAHPDAMEAELAALETDNAAMREVLNNLCLSADALQCKYDQEDSDVIAVRLDLDEADLVLTLPTDKVLVDVEKLREIVDTLGTVVPSDQNAMIAWAVKSGNAVYTHAGAAYYSLIALLKDHNEN